jgi:hypothetical protein
MLIFLVLGVFVLGIALNSIDTPAVRRAKKVRQLEAEVGVARPQDVVEGKSNQEYIDALEKEIFGVEKEISGLPGYYWEVKLDANGDFQIDLTDPRHKVRGTRRVLQEKVKKDSYGYPVGRSQKTEQEIEYGFQHSFGVMVKAELERVRAEEVKKRMLEKYNGKAVETK